MSTFVVFSHLRWDFVFQRPQQLLSRIAREHRVVFIEEPVRDRATPWIESIDAGPGVVVLRPHTNVDAPGFDDAQLPILRALLGPTLASLNGAIAWFYTPMALPLLVDLSYSKVVYDCMDELSAFRDAPRQLRQREHALLQQADLVFTGGQSLFEAKRNQHASVYCFPSSVDAQHFRRDSTKQATPSDKPLFGFFGVVDERFDATLLDALATAEPDWRFEIVGPVVKVDPRSLPQHDNIKYLGMKAYAELPEIVASWDVCLMPFAYNDSTRYISPTKVLEYMAAEKPIVSTAIRDVVGPYSKTVYIGDTAEAFIASCRAALVEPAPQRQARLDAMRAIVDATSWERTAAEMTALVVEDAGNDAAPVARRRPVAAVRSVPASAKSEAIGTAIIGAGPTGLSAAYHLGENARLFERGPEVGGWCRSIVDHGFTFDYAGHIMFSNDPIVLEMYKVLLGDNIHWQNREAWIYSHDVHTRYPFQGALYGLPPDVLKDCLVGAIEARYGSIDSTKAAPAAVAAAPVCERPATRALSTNQTEVGTAPAGNDDCCGDGEYARPDTSVDKVVPLSIVPRNFEEFIMRTWGSGVAKHFALPYNRKLWALPLTEMETSWLGGRVPLPDLAEMIEGAVQPAKKPVGPNARFGYPLRGGFQALMDGFLPYVKKQLECNADVVAIDLDERRLELADGRQYTYEQLISTIPLPKLIELLADVAPAEVRRAAEGLRHVSVRCVNLGINRAAITDKHWIYYPGDTVFHRIFVQGNTSPHCNPPGGFGLTCEITHGPSKPLPCEGEELIQRCFDDCVKVGLLREDDELIVGNQVDMDYAYVVYDHARAANVATIRAWLSQHDILLAGRYSEWEYYNSDHAFLAGRRVAMQVESERHVQQNIA